VSKRELNRFRTHAIPSPGFIFDQLSLGTLPCLSVPAESKTATISYLPWLSSDPSL